MAKTKKKSVNKKIGLETYKEDSGGIPDDTKKQLEEKITMVYNEVPKKFFTVTWIDWIAVSLLIIIMIFMVMDRQRVLAFIFGIAVVLYILKMSIRVK